MGNRIISGQNLTANALRILERRYLVKDESGYAIESPDNMFRRVAAVVSLIDQDPDSESQFYHMMSHLEFLPNSPTLMNAGTDIGQLSACFVIPVGDSMKEIFDAVTSMALIHQSGGGTGFSFSRLRPRDDPVRSTGGIASGPVSFMRIFDTATEVIKQGGRRRGANMGILRAEHPDIMEFIFAKEKENFLTNFNLSVAVTDYFMECFIRDGDYELINPKTKQTVKSIKARVIFDAIASAAWNTGDPGIIFIDEINRYNPVPDIGEIEATNPCGEQPLLP
ncbi:MAG: ribonucleotide reductase N-terminal alpha domain-containing protein, partial [Nitrospirota bacterium]